MNRFAWLLFLIFIGMNFAETKAETKAEESLPNFVFAIADDWGWPHAGAYGDAAVKTPTFDGVAKRGVLFEHAFVSSPSCTPSRGAIITGQYFWRLKAAANLHAIWPDNTFPEFPALLRDAGYHVGHYRKAWGPGKAEQRPDGKRYRSVEEFFDSRGEGQPFCFWFGASDPHRGYKAGSGKESGIQIDQVHLFPWFPDNEIVRNDVADYYFEVQRFDRQVGELLSQLKAKGELENTYVFITGDHGMPFPRCKGNLYDGGARVPLAVQGPSMVGNRVITDFVSLTDIAPTFLDAAKQQIPDEMTGRSLLPILHSEQAGRVESQRNFVLTGRERHVIAQERPNRGGYPSRAIRTEGFLYIRNFEPDRWPQGTPNYEKATRGKAWLADCDNSPTKMELWKHRESEAHRGQYDLCFAKRPAEELYDLESDPHQIVNVAGQEKYGDAKDQLAQQLISELRKYKDPRAMRAQVTFDEQPYSGGAPQWPGDKKKR